MSTPITNTVSTFINSQLPDFVREQNPNFVAFIKAYYSWMEQQPSSNVAVITQAKSLLSYHDLDSTTDEFIQYYINQFLPFFPNDVALDERKLIKAARQFYQKKGSLESIQFLFRVLYGKEADIYYPKNNILKASDGKWVLPQALRLLLTQPYENFDVQMLVNRVGIGANSNTQCVIESATEVVDANLGFEIVEVYISNITKPFQDLENLNIMYGNDANGNPLVFSEKIIAALSNIVINPNYRGTQYFTGDPVVIIGGLEPNDPQAQEAVAYVGNVTVGSITSINVIFGGYDYRENPNTIVSVVNAPGDNTGAGANVIVSSIDTTNSTYMLVNTDSIEFKQYTALSCTDFLFANASGININSPIGSALSYANLQFAPIKTMNVVNGGGGYQKLPSLNLQVTYFSDFTNDLYLINDPVDAANTIQYIDDLGYFAAVQIANSGIGYSNTRDTIVCESAIGYGATFNFTTDGSGRITNVYITNRGAGYFVIPPLTVANSVNTNLPGSGTGAVLIGYGFGQGANVALGVNKIGTIIDFNLVNRGFDYISTPNISLRIEDLIINPINVNQVILQDSIIYQGANANLATFVANVSSLNYMDNVLRIYNYRGTLNVYANLVATLITNQTVNLTINTAVTNNVTIYGDGLAKANAVFLNGLIKYPGFYLTTDGMLSSDQYLEDANTYHNYSYQIIVEQAMIDYKQTLMKIAHPVGMSMLGIYAIEAPTSVATNTSSKISYISPLTGSINTNSLIAVNPYVQGTGTDWAINGVMPGDLIVFNPSDSSRKLQVKTITSVQNFQMGIDSNTQFVYPGLASVVNGSNLIYTDSNVIGNIAPGDFVQMNIGGLQTYDISAVGANTLSIGGTFTQNLSNLVMLVNPTFSGASYQIISANAV